jgi:hypothetical protein
MGEPPKVESLVRTDESEPWSGDDHMIRSDAAREAGLSGSDAEVESYTAGFKAGMTLEDPFDKAIVLRGRTVLRPKQLTRSIKPMLRFLRIAPDDVGLKIHDGSFELRVSGAAAERAAPAADSAKVALKLWIGVGLVGFLFYTFVSPILAGILWGVALLVGGWTLRQGLVSGRSMLAARLTVGLAMLAQEEQLILPPSGAALSPESSF